MDSDNYNNYIKYKIKYINLKNHILQNGGEYSNMFVYNKLKNIIENIPVNFFDNKIHLYINDKKLEKIAKKNDLQIKKIIKSDKNYKNKFYHVSINEFIYPFINTKDNYSTWLGSNLYKNPRGIWLSCGLSWQNFIGNLPNPWSLATYIYEIDISNTVLHIKSLLELENFINHYMKKNPKITDIIDWKKVKKNYDGLIISPYLGDKIWGKNSNKFSIYGKTNENINNYYSKILDSEWSKNLFFTAEWYRHWEESSGVIWNPSTGIRSIKIIKKINLDYILQS